MPDEPYNPLDKRRLAESVAQALLASETTRVDTIPSFEGAGIYALYYAGDFPLYAAVRLNADTADRPIYVGKAVPKGGRKGGWGLGLAPGTVLSGRLREHARSIEESSDLDPSDFFARYLVVDDVWIPLAESLLIEWFSPVWNTVLDGFGNHDPGSGRYRGQRPAWDTIHVGRAWAARLQPNAKSQEEWQDLVTRALAGDQTVQRLTPDEAVIADEGEPE